MKKSNKKLKQKQKQKQKQTVIVNIDNSKKTARRKPSKGTSQPKEPQPTIIPQPIYIPQYNYPAPPPFRTETNNVRTFDANMVADNKPTIIADENRLPRPVAVAPPATPLPPLPNPSSVFVSEPMQPAMPLKTPASPPPQLLNPARLLFSQLPIDEPEPVPEPPQIEEPPTPIEGYNASGKKAGARPRRQERICQATQANGMPCRNKAKFGSFCGKHRNAATEPTLKRSAWSP
jgi:hypothetical protein